MDNRSEFIKPTTTALFLLPFVILHFALACMALRARIKTGTYFGISSSPSTTSNTDPSNKDPPKRLSPSSPIHAFDPMVVASRAHANFAENVPLGLVVAAVVEMCGADKGKLAWALGLFLGLRIAHAVGMFRNNRGRAVGFVGGLGVVVVMAVWGLVLGLR